MDLDPFRNGAVVWLQQLRTFHALWTATRGVVWPSNRRYHKVAKPNRSSLKGLLRFFIPLRQTSSHPFLHDNGAQGVASNRHHRAAHVDDAVDARGNSHTFDWDARRGEQHGQLHALEKLQRRQASQQPYCRGIDHARMNKEAKVSQSN